MVEFFRCQEQDMDLVNVRNKSQRGDRMSIFPITITDEEAETIIAFIKNHEREDIPDDVWDVCMKLMDLTDRY